MTLAELLARIPKSPLRALAPTSKPAALLYTLVDLAATDAETGGGALDEGILAAGVGEVAQAAAEAGGVWEFLELVGKAAGRDAYGTVEESFALAGEVLGFLRDVEALGFYGERNTRWLSLKKHSVNVTVEVVGDRARVTASTPLGAFGYSGSLHGAYRHCVRLAKFKA